MGAYPFTAKNEGALIRKILKGQYPQPSGYSADLLNIIKLCLAYDAKKRPSASVLLSRPEISAKAASIHAAQARQRQIKSHTDEAHWSPSQHDGGHTRLADHQEALVLDRKPCMESCGEDKQRHPFALDPTKVAASAHVCTISKFRITIPGSCRANLVSCRTVRHILHMSVSPVRQLSWNTLNGIQLLQRDTKQQDTRTKNFLLSTC